VRSTVAITLAETEQLAAALWLRQLPLRKSPVWFVTPYPEPLSAALASPTVRLHDVGRETRKVEALALNERIVYGEAAVPALCGSSSDAAELVWLQVRVMGQSPEKPKGYGTVVLPHWRSHRTPPLTAEVAWRRKGRRRRRRRRRRESRRRI